VVDVEKINVVFLNRLFLDQRDVVAPFTDLSWSFVNWIFFENCDRVNFNKDWVGWLGSQINLVQLKERLLLVMEKIHYNVLMN